MTTFKEGYPQARDMEGIERAVSALCDDATGLLEALAPELRAGLLHSLLALVARQQNALDQPRATPEHPPECIRDLAPVETPVYSALDERTGNLHIKFPTRISHRERLAWRVLEITPAAAKDIAAAVRELLPDHEPAANTPPTQGTLQ